MTIYIIKFPFSQQIGLKLAFLSVSESDQAEFASRINASPPASQPCLHSTENSPNMAPNNKTVEHKDVASSGQVGGEHTEESQGQSDSSSSVEKNEAGNEVKESTSTSCVCM